MIPLLTVDQMRRTEEAFVRDGGDLDDLMQRAGREVASRIEEGHRTLLLAGPGNNGGDALVAARILQERGEQVHVYAYRRQSEPHLSATTVEEDHDGAALERQLERCDVVVDGLLGIGRRRPVEGALAEVISRVNSASGKHRVAIDIPTGVDADTGAAQGTTFQADLTLTLGFGKRGLWSFPGAEYAGRVEIADIGLGPYLPESVRTALITPDDVSALLPKRSRDWNKGKSGTVLCLAGSRDYSGAPVLVSTAAYRAGAGLVQLAVPNDIRTVVAGHGVEAIFAPVEVADACFGEEALAPLADSLDRADSFALGPGLGRRRETRSFVVGLLRELQKRDLPGVLDADGLNAVSDVDSWWENVPRRLVVTPHPGEMARLLHCSIEEVQHDRFSSAQRAARGWRVVVVLKGSLTVVAGPDGALTVNPTGGANLGVGGTGDVLTGMIAGLLAQGMEPDAAAIAGVFLHGAAGDALRDKLGDAGTMASDLWGLIPKVRKRIERGE